MLNKIKNMLSRTKTKKIDKPQMQNDEKISKKSSNPNNFDEICPKVVVDEKKAIKEMNETNKQNNKEINRNNYGDGDPDGDDLDI